VTVALKALLLDIGGTLHVGQVWLPGAQQALRDTERRGLQLRMVSNLTKFSRRQVLAWIAASGFELPPGSLFTAASAAGDWFARQAPQRPRVLALCRPELAEDLSPFCELVEAAPAEYVLVADMGSQHTLARMDEALRALLAGASLVGMERNRFYRLADGYHLDSGPFLAALEFAAGKPAQAVFGKPNPSLFRLALASAGAEPGEALMVGDDLECDVLLPRQLGLATALVKTGKFMPQWGSQARQAGVPVLESVADLPALLDAMGVARG
jgi:HAD superfamily hydrolase (TIGR01458 family)